MAGRSSIVQAIVFLLVFAALIGLGFVFRYGYDQLFEDSKAKVAGIWVFLMLALGFEWIRRRGSEPTGAFSREGAIALGIVLLGLVVIALIMMIGVGNA